MAITSNIEIETQQLWPQGDVRDPLGIWGGRSTIAGDGSGNPLKLVWRTPAGQRAAYVYTLYSVTYAKIVGSAAAVETRTQILTNWPNVDPQAGVQAFATAIVQDTGGTDNFDSPNSALRLPVIRDIDRFILIFDPRPGPGLIDILSMAIADNGVGNSWTFECYGYYWDRSVMNAPGGPRHPGSN